MVTPKDIQEIFNLHHIRPINLIKGPVQYRFGKMGYVSRQMMDDKTLIYECIYKDTFGVVKILIKPDKNRTRFLRELYVYRTIASTPLWKPFTSRLLHYELLVPMPFFIIEKITGQPLGDWFHMHYNDPKILHQIIDAVYSMHKSTALPEYMRYGSFDKVNYFMKFTFKMRRTLRLLDESTRVNVIKARGNMARYLQPYWGKIDNGFIFNDLNPANVLISPNKKFKFIDFDQVGYGKFEYDLSFLYLAALGNDQEQIFLSTIKSFVKYDSNKVLLDFFLFHRLLITTYWFKKETDSNKFNACLNQLSGIVKNYS